ncbi:MAG: FecR domain-containing protein [Kiritimatiellae bacterium]|nr:FecR domain-containing protein [Kiritimatiellia bacterium]
MNAQDIEQIQAYIADELGEGQTDELLARLRSEPALRRAWVGTIRNESLLWEFGSERRFSILASAIGATEADPRMRPAPAGTDLTRRIRPAGAGQLPPGRWTRRLMALAASVLIGLGLFVSWYLNRLPALAEGIATITHAAGAVHRVHGGVRTAARAQTPLFGGDSLLAAGPQGLARVAYGSAVIELGPDTAVVFEPEPGRTGRHLRVGAGTIEADIEPPIDARGMAVLTPHAAIRVTGTRFTVRVNAESTRVDLSRGRLEVTNLLKNESFLLQQGHYAVIGPQTVVAAGPAFGREDAVPQLRTPHLQVLYVFDEKQGPIVHDRSGAGAPLHLRIRDERAVEWRAGGGLLVKSPTVIACAAPPTRLLDACRASHALSIEVWIRPLRSEQSGPARIVSFGGGAEAQQNFMLGQEFRLIRPPRRVYLARVRTTENAKQPYPMEPVSAQNSVRTELTHLVFRRTATGEVQLYINGHCPPAGFVRGGKDRPYDWFGGTPVIPGDFSNWSPDYRLTLANEATGDRPWLGELHLVAVYSRALSEAEIRRHFQAGAPARHAAVAQPRP